MPGVVRPPASAGPSPPLPPLSTSSSSSNVLVDGNSVLLDDGARFSFRERVVCAVWCTFPGDAYAAVAGGGGAHAMPSALATSPASTSLAVLYGARGLFVYTRTGATFDVVLPFPARAAFPLHCGLLLQRETGAKGGEREEERETDGRAGGLGAASPAGRRPRAATGIPVWYSLFHPLEEPSPVAVLGDSADGPGAPRSVATDLLLAVVDAHPTSPTPTHATASSPAAQHGPPPPSRLVVSWDAAAAALRVWYVVTSPVHPSLLHFDAGGGAGVGGLASAAAAHPQHTLPFPHPHADSSRAGRGEDAAGRAAGPADTSHAAGAHRLPLTRGNPPPPSSSSSSSAAAPSSSTPLSARSGDMGGSTRRTVRFRTPAPLQELSAVVEGLDDLDDAVSRASPHAGPAAPETEEAAAGSGRDAAGRNLLAASSSSSASFFDTRASASSGGSGGSGGRGGGPGGGAAVVLADPTSLEERAQALRYRALLHADAGERGGGRRRQLRSPAAIAASAAAAAAASVTSAGASTTSSSQGHTTAAAPLVPHAFLFGSYRSTGGMSTTTGSGGHHSSSTGSGAGEDHGASVLHPYDGIAADGSGDGPSLYDADAMDAITTVDLDDSFNAPDSTILERNKQQPHGKHQGRQQRRSFGRAGAARDGSGMVDVESHVSMGGSPPYAWSADVHATRLDSSGGVDAGVGSSEGDRSRAHPKRPASPGSTVRSGASSPSFSRGTDAVPSAEWFPEVEDEDEDAALEEAATEGADGGAAAALLISSEPTVVLALAGELRLPLLRHALSTSPVSVVGAVAADVDGAAGECAVLVLLDDGSVIPCTLHTAAARSAALLACAAERGGPGDGGEDVDGEAAMWPHVVTMGSTLVPGGGGAGAPLSPARGSVVPLALPGRTRLPGAPASDILLLLLHQPAASPAGSVPLLLRWLHHGTECAAWHMPPLQSEPSASASSAYRLLRARYVRRGGSSLSHADSEDGEVHVEVAIVGADAQAEPVALAVPLPHFGLDHPAVVEAASLAEAAATCSADSEALLQARLDIMHVRAALLAAASVVSGGATFGIDLPYPSSSSSSSASSSGRINVHVRVARTPRVCATTATPATLRLLSPAAGSTTTSAWRVTFPVPPTRQSAELAAVRLIEAVSSMATTAAADGGPAAALLFGPGASSHAAFASPPRAARSPAAPYGATRSSSSAQATPATAVRMMRRLHVGSPEPAPAPSPIPAPAAISAAVAAVTPSPSDSAPTAVVHLRAPTACIAHLRALAGIPIAARVDGDAAASSSSSSSAPALRHGDERRDNLSMSISARLRLLPSSASADRVAVASALLGGLAASTIVASGGPAAAAAWGGLRAPRPPPALLLRALAAAAGTLFSSGDCSPAQAYLAAGRVDLAALCSLAAAATSMSGPAVAAGSSPYLRSALRSLLLPMPGGVGLGVLTTHGTTGRPATEAGAVGAAAAVVINAALGIGDVSAGAGPDQDVDGVDALSSSTFGGLRFGRDRRMRTLGRLLRSCRPHYLRLQRPPEMTDHDYVAAQQQMLFFHARRVCGSIMGRGMLTVGTVLPSFTDPVPIPVITVAARMPPMDVLIKLDVSAVTTSLAGITDWPEFFNGCAAGLRLAAPLGAAGTVGAAQGVQTGAAGAGFNGSGGGGGGGGGGGDALLARLIRAWVRSHRYTGIPPDLGAVAATAAAVATGIGVGAPAAAGIPSAGMSSGLVPPNAAHGGLLLALGMTGALNGMSSSDIYEYLAQTHSCTTVGLLLGLAAGRRGSGDPGVHKAVCLHLPAVLPSSYQDVDVPPVVQASALVSLGLLYQASGHRAMAEFLLREIGRAPIPWPVSERGDEREAYSACAGLALGLVTLGLGPGEDADVWRAGGGSGGPPAPSSGGGAGGAHAQAGAAIFQDLEMDDKLLRYMVGGRDPDAPSRRKAEAASASSRPNLLFEGDRLNTNVTAPSAVLALGLTYLRSGNRRIANALAAPETSLGLDCVRPDVLILRAMARTIVMWHEHDADDGDLVFDYAAWREDHGYGGLGPGSGPGPVGAASGIPGPVEARARWEHARRLRLRRWITSQIPAYVRRVVRRLYTTAAATSGPGAAALKLAQLMAMVDDEDEEAEKGKGEEAAKKDGAAAPPPPAPDAKKAAQQPPAPPPAAAAPKSTAPVDTSDGPLEQLDLEQARAAYVDILAGCSLGLGLRYAGTGDPIVRDEILTHLSYALALRELGLEEAGAGAAAKHKGVRDGKAEAARASALAAATHARADASALAAARALFEELTGVRGLPTGEAVALVNELVFLPSEAAPTADDLVLPTPEPARCFPFRLSEDGATVVAASDGAQSGAAAGGPAAAPFRALRSGPTSRVLAASIPIAASCTPPAHILQAAIASLVSGLGMVMAGSGDVATLRVMRELRRRVDSTVSYGDMMASGMALGLVGLGGGKATLSRSNEAVAALVASFFPCWPHGTASNAYFIQAPRTLYALAVDHRCVDTVEVGGAGRGGGVGGRGGAAAAAALDGAAVGLSGPSRPVHAALEVTLRPHGGKAPRRLRLVTPCILPELATLQTVRVLGPTHHEYELDVAGSAGHAAVFLQGAQEEGGEAAAAAAAAAEAAAAAGDSTRLDDDDGAGGGTGDVTATAATAEAPGTPAAAAAAAALASAAVANASFRSVQGTPLPESTPVSAGRGGRTGEMRVGGAGGGGSPRAPSSSSGGTTALMFLSPDYVRRQQGPQEQASKRRRRESEDGDAGEDRAAVPAAPPPAAASDLRAATGGEGGGGGGSLDVSFDLGGVDLGGPGASASASLSRTLTAAATRLRGGGEAEVASAAPSSTTTQADGEAADQPSWIVDAAAARAQAHARRSLRPIVLFVQRREGEEDGRGGGGDEVEGYLVG
jgi:hypothetical protein